MRLPRSRAFQAYDIGFVLLAAAAAAVCGLSAPVLAAPPVLSHLFPAGGQRGAKVTVTCTGEFAWPVKAWGSGIEVVPAAEAGKLEITIPADLPADRVWVRLFNAEGASATVPFLIGTLPEVEEKEPNNSPRAAQTIVTPQVTINGVLLDGDVDGFAVTLEAGQTLVAAVDANTRLGSPIDAILQVASTNGTVLAENHDDLQLDPRLAFTASRAGTYIVRLFAFPSTPGTKIAFHGAANCVYRLTLTTGGFVTHALPLAVPANEPGTVEVLGWNIPAGTRLPVVQFGPTRSEILHEFEPIADLRISPDAQVGLAFGGNLAGEARVRVSPEIVSLISADAGVESPLPLPSCVSGCLKKPGQSDSFRIPLKKGQILIVTAESRSFGLALDPLVQLADPTGATVAEADDTGASRDAAVTHTAAHDGEYRLSVRDRYRQGGPRGGYLLSVRLEQPDFEVSSTIDAVVVPAGKPVEVPIKILRRASSEGAIGPITFEAVGLPADVQAPPVVSEPTGPTAAEVKLTLTLTGAAFSGPIRVVGKAAQPKEITRFARTPPKMGGALETIWLTVTPAP